MFELTGFQRDLLYVISGLDDPTGQEVRRELERTQERSIQEGQLYRNLDQLVEKGLVDKQTGSGRTNHYANTDDGTSVVEDLHDWRLQHLDAEQV
ncbi:helix-turn-helix transcriptional regulator [Halobacteriales archaeon Cl-PHB]